MTGREILKQVIDITCLQARKPEKTHHFVIEVVG